MAKQYSENKAKDGDASPATRYHSAISKAMENPAKSKLETIEGIVEALNGELRIIWEPGTVITLQLDNEQMTALEERAKNEGVTVSKVAEHLLQLALSGVLAQKPKRLTELVIAEETKIYRSMHPLIESAYSAVHQWLATRPEAEGYKELDYSKDLEKILGKADLKSTAFQYYTLFPRYFFESVHVLDKVINSTRLPSVLKYNPRICILDVGCAMGAASAALIERIINLKQSESISNHIEFFCLGIDPNIFGLVLYKELMQEIKNNVSHLNVNVEFQYIPILEGEGFSKAIITAMRHLQKKREQWKQPTLSNLLLMQLDVASSPPSQNIASRLKQKSQLQAMGLELDDAIENLGEFWQEEALAYKQLLEAVPLENLYISTIGTKIFENNLKAASNIDNFSDVIQQIIEQFNQVIGNGHRVSMPLSGEQQVNFDNPADSYWYEQHKLNYESKFLANFSTIVRKQLEDDKDWQKLTSLENLQEAWVKARRNLLHIESCYDEIEIKLFEHNLDNNLRIMQEKMLAFCDEIIDGKEVINYNFVKSSSASRPKQLSRLEEEILASAIIQTIGRKANMDFYSYCPQKESLNDVTEYLYENYLGGYQRFVKEARKSAEEYQDGAVIRTDIKSYYKTVVREQLLDITKRELNIISDRVYWFLEKIYSVDLDGHKSGIGISQGTTTSGFYANLYLSQVDKKFNNDKTWRVKFHRYVDDMIIVLPSVTYLEEVESALKVELKILELELNKDKTEHYENVSDFLETIKDDKILEKFSRKFNLIIYRLWVVNAEYRTNFEFANKSGNERLWWKLISLYQQCLYSLNIHVTKTYLSRKIYQYIFQQKQRKNRELNLPPFPNSDNYSVISNWARRFEELETGWLNDKNSLKQEILNLFTQSLLELKRVSEQLHKSNTTISKQEKRQLIVQRRRLETRIRFTINKLIILGFDDVWQEIVNLICSDFVIRDLLDVVISLARQGYTDAINQLKQCYQNSSNETSEYLRAVILEALRFLPSLNLKDWEFIFEAATEGKSDIEKLKATETWLYLGDVAKQFVQAKHIQAVVNALNSEPQPFTRLKKNYILILGMHAPDEIINVSISPKELDDYLIADALNLAQDGKVSELFKEDEPAIIRQYYSVKKTSDSEDKHRYSL
ncbi:RNA-directed DNA polymerase [Nostoc sp. UHCC 0702]|nr:RNA-directed DNA polymerase [Nostoc sp. UHCC 0702]